MTTSVEKKVRNRTLVAVFSLFIVGMLTVDLVRRSRSDSAGVEALKALSARTQVQRGRPRALPLSDIRFRDGDGATRSLADLPRGMVLLNIWATWCPPCREELPDLDRLQETLGGKDFRVVALSVDEGGLPAVERFYRQVNVRALQPYASTRETLHQLQVSALPTTLLIDADGHEVWRISGPLPWTRKDVVEMLRAQIPPR